MTEITGARSKIHQEEVDYRSVVSEATLTKLGESINWILENASDQVGDIRQSFLTEAQFQTQRGSTWVLCDGRSVVGSDYETLTGNSNIPDMRGRFFRMKDNGRSLDPQGDAALETERADTYGSHNHQERAVDSASAETLTDMEYWSSTSGGSPSSVNTIFYDNLTTGGTRTNAPLTTANSGSSETAPLHIVGNVFIKINE